MKHGWALRVLRKKRTVVWMGPCEGSFQVLFILGAKALQAAREAGLPASVVEAMGTAPKYPVGTGVRLQIKAKRDLVAVKRLAAIKIAN